MVFNFLRRKKDKDSKQDIKTNSIKVSFGSIFDKIKALSGNTGKLNPELKEELKKTLINADMGVSLTTEVLDKLTQSLNNKEATPEEIRSCLSKIMNDMIPEPTPINTATDKPTTILMIGINGAGKTTTCGKIAYQLSEQGKKVTLAAGDTYRAAAIEQLQTWGERSGCKVVAQKQGADSASVIHDALMNATAGSMDFMIADTSGRLHTQANLMGELKKIKKVLAKIDPDSPHEIWLVLDASLGQNNIQQAETFKNEIGVTGVIITKLDGSGKGGSIFSIAQQVKLPVRYIGTGETAEDLKKFNKDDFINNILE
jgi:fused signal recognition particle receptor